MYCYYALTWARDQSQSEGNIISRYDIYVVSLYWRCHCVRRRKRSSTSHCQMYIKCKTYPCTLGADNSIVFAVEVHKSLTTFSSLMYWVKRYAEWTHQNVLLLCASRELETNPSLKAINYLNMLCCVSVLKVSCVVCVSKTVCQMYYQM